MIVAFTGHRPDKLGGYKIPNPVDSFVRNELIKILQNVKPSYAITGMALGFDQLAAEVCIGLGIKFSAYVPFIGQEKRWPPVSIDRYNNIIKFAIEVKVISPGAYSPEKMDLRNMAMVNKCSRLIACFDGSKGGTANCFNYALSKAVPIIRIDPRIYDANKFADNVVKDIYGGF